MMLLAQRNDLSQPRSVCGPFESVVKGTCLENYACLIIFAHNCFFQQLY